MALSYKKKAKAHRFPPKSYNIINLPMYLLHSSVFTIFAGAYKYIKV